MSMSNRQTGAAETPPEGFVRLVVLRLDLIMPGTNGFQVLAEMRQDPALMDIPVVLLTATSPKEDTQPDSQITIGRSDGLRISEVLRCLEAAIAIIEPHYDDRATLDHAPEPNALRSSVT